MDESKSPVYGPDRMMMGDVAKQPLQDVAKQPLQDISNFLKSPVETEMRKDGRENWEDGEILFMSTKYKVQVH